MLYRLASSEALPGVGEAMATTSASFRIWKEAAWMSAWNWEPMMPTFTLPSAMQSPSSAAFAFVLTPLKRRPFEAQDKQDRRTPNYEDGVGSSQPTNSCRMRLPLYSSSSWMPI